MENKKTDCEACNIELINNVRPNMPETSILYLLNMTKSAVSHQLKVLRTAKLVRPTKKGKNVFYALDDEHVKHILEKALDHVLE